MEVRTHEKIDQRLCGIPEEVKAGYSRVTLIAVPEMAADDSGLMHGGFVFGQADYAAMIAVNHPHVVLGASSAKFLRPVRVGETVEAEARVISEKGRKKIVSVTVRRGEEPVFEGEFTCFVLDHHVLNG